MRIFNADGGEVEACGNATRAVALLHGAPARIDTAGGMLEVAAPRGRRSGRHGRSRASTGTRSRSPMRWTRIDMPVGWDELEQPAAVNVGNPHAVFFVPDCDAVALERLGPLIERDPLFPQRVNVNVATVENRRSPSACACGSAAPG